MFTLVPIFAQAAVAGSLGYLLIWAIVIAAIVAIGLTFFRGTGVAIPPGIVTVLWIVLAAFVAIWAIRFLLSAV